MLMESAAFEARSVGSATKETAGTGGSGEVPASTVAASVSASAPTTGTKVAAEPGQDRAHVSTVSVLAPSLLLFLLRHKMVHCFQLAVR